MNRVLVPDQTRVLGFDFINVIVQKQKSSRIHMFSSIPKNRVFSLFNGSGGPGVIKNRSRLGKNLGGHIFKILA